jgi:hypothetical protein
MKPIWLLILLSTASISTAFAVECENCRVDFYTLRENLLKRDQTIGLLAKNERYLASLKAEEASKYLKVSSNVVVILKKLDGIKADAEKVEERLTKHGCAGCQISAALGSGASSVSSESKFEENPENK